MALVRHRLPRARRSATAEARFDELIHPSWRRFRARVEEVVHELDSSNDSVDSQVGGAAELGARVDDLRSDAAVREFVRTDPLLSFRLRAVGTTTQR